MKSLSRLATSVILAAGMHIDAHAQTAGTEPTRPEVNQYRSEVRQNMRNILESAGLEIDGVRAKSFRYYHLGYPIGTTGWNIGVQYQKFHGLPPLIEEHGKKVQFGVSFILRGNILN